MTVRYIYLDDSEPDQVRTYIGEMHDQSGGELVIEHLRPESYQITMERLDNALNREEAEPHHGVVLDLRLDEFFAGKGEKPDFRASTLAQELRTRATERRLPPHPIVLWSTDDRLRHTFHADETARDLYDLLCAKEEVENERTSPAIAAKLLALVTGYERIEQVLDRGDNLTSRFYEILGFEDLPDFLDERINTHFDAKLEVLRDEEQIAAHEYARFLIRELLEFPGPLLDRDVLAARLGIDQSRSPEFDRLIDAHFSTCQYAGPFGTGWRRWWSALVDQQWRRFENAKSARNLTAVERVEFLKARTGVDGIVAAEPIDESHSARFWTVCEVTRRPLDPRDGLVLEAEPRYSWQTKRYISVEAYLSGEHRESGLKVDPIEAPRLERLHRAA